MSTDKTDVKMGVLHAAQELKTLLPQMTPANMSSGAWNILKELVNAVQDNTS
nr:thymidine kinase, TK [varicella zoster virus VZV, isolates 2 and 3, acyclovir-resistant, Peptide Mutant, 51 aa] [Human alphaherpesvirus 3]